MKTLFVLLAFLFGLTSVNPQKAPQKIFDVHLHGSKDPLQQMLTLQKAGVYKAAISTSWDLQKQLQENSKFPLPVWTHVSLPKWESTV